MREAEAEELAGHILQDLRETLPADLRWSVRVDEEMVYVCLRREGSPGLSSESGSPLDFSRCHLAGKIVSDVQDFMADAYAV